MIFVFNSHLCLISKIFSKQEDNSKIVMVQNKIKILMVLANTRMEGAQAFILNILRNIDQHKYHIDFAINFYAEYDGIELECRKYGCEFYILPYFKVYNYLKYCNQWDKFLSTHKYDIVYAHSTNSASFILKIAKKYNMKTIAHSHSAGYRGSIIEQYAKRFFAKGTKKVADYWFACSEEAALRLYGKDYDKSKRYYSIPNSIDPIKYLFDTKIRKSIRDKINVTDDEFLCGHVGSFTTPKNHIFLVDIFADILKNNPQAKLICCGAGILRENIVEYAQKLCILDRILFVGVVQNVNEYMMAMDCFVFPSIFEGFPVSILEAQATGLPIVMSDVITHEVDLTILIHRMNLLQSPSEWSNVILNTSANDRRLFNSAIINTKYNIKQTIKVFEKLYTQLVNE